ncbi:hypothetical protein JHN55_36265 [Streptomyces sp. MBT56]|uniref:hypothetical protein n=1 Tax=Streptomyces TaxID=1883 RepID=UPI00190DA8D3|nr:MULTISPECIES: hypothetical protein [unclassified Streptomyces]MBK3561896.1 hypothetical protein [Streptomyces sp. MBT56]MBK3603944.1 hypothetical protein [Streptomyces sp. MBT54]MBK3615827.1 hypothetical protein [Streptomyces sp. MBT98]MBK6043406.1 hypothetical protein [Streptomyces sp. MBT55]
MGDALHLVRTPHFDAVFMLGEEDDEATVEDVDVLVTLEDGRRFSATFLTPAAVVRWMDSETREYERLHFQCPDLVITRHPGVAAMVRVLELAWEHGDLTSLLSELEPSSPDDDG